MQGLREEHLANYIQQPQTLRTLPGRAVATGNAIKLEQEHQWQLYPQWFKRPNRATLGQVTANSPLPLVSSARRCAPQWATPMPGPPKERVSRMADRRIASLSTLLARSCTSRMRCWAACRANVACRAAIRGGGTTQHTDGRNNNPPSCRAAKHSHNNGRSMVALCNDVHSDGKAFDTNPPPAPDKTLLHRAHLHPARRIAPSECAHHPRGTLPARQSPNQSTSSSSAAAFSNMESFGVSTRQ